jgi:hypothetical protein
MYFNSVNYISSFIKLTNSMEKKPFWEAVVHSASEENPLLLWNTKFH